MTGLTPYPGITEGTRGITLYQGITAPGGIVDIGSADSFQPVGGSLLLTGLGPKVTFPPRTFTPTGGSMTLTGLTPGFMRYFVYGPSAGTLTITGIIPEVTFTSIAATFDAALSGTHLTLSNGDLTATAGLGLTEFGETAFGSASAVSPAKKYFETVFSVASDTSATGIGFSSGSFSGANQYLGRTPGESVGFYLNGSIYFSDSILVDTWSGASTGDTLGLAIDGLDVWIRINGSWDGGGDPGTGTTPTFTMDPSMAVTLYPGATLGTIADAVTANFGATAYANAAPSGFGNW